MGISSWICTERGPNIWDILVYNIINLKIKLVETSDNITITKKDIAIHIQHGINEIKICSIIIFLSLILTTYRATRNLIHAR